MAWKEPHERQSDELIEAVNRAAHLVSKTLAAGFHLLAAAASPSVLPNGTDNSPAIKAATKKLNDLTDQLHKSNPPT